ncbi:MAG: calcium-binding protein [Reyranellaceae bacterium]
MASYFADLLPRGGSSGQNRQSEQLSEGDSSEPAPLGEAATWTFVPSTGFSANFDVPPIAPGATLALYSTAGTTTLGSGIPLDGFHFPSEENAIFGVGNGTTDRIVGSDQNDLIVWDRGTIMDLANAALQQRQRLPGGNQTQAVDIFQLGAGDDILNLTHNAASGTPQAPGTSPGVYDFAATAYGSFGNDLIALSTANDLAYGDLDPAADATPAMDTLRGSDGNDTLFGDLGSLDANVTVGANDTLFGGIGGDTIFGEGGNDTAFGEADNDTLFGGGGADALHGDELDGLLGASGNDTIYGGSGGDSIYGGRAEDLVFGDNGADRLFGGGNADTLYGGAGPDSLYGGEANDVLDGGIGGAGGVADALFGESGNDTLIAAAGDNVLDAGSVRLWNGIAADAAVVATISAAVHVIVDTFDGGDGTDTIIGTDQSDAFLLIGGDAGAPPTTGPGGGQLLVGVEVILAGAGNDYVSLNHLDTDGAGPDASVVWTREITLIGGEDSDTMFAGAANDVLWGDTVGPIGGSDPSDGADYLAGGGGSDTIYGGGGNDEIHTGSTLSPLAAFDTAFGGDGNDTLFGGANVDTLYGGADDDVIFNAGSQAIGEAFFGGAGNDVMILTMSNVMGALVVDAGPNDASDGNDFVQIYGRYNTVTATLGGGNDTYIGDPDFNPDAGVGTLVDIVNGGEGNDVISAWYGDDTISGGRGEDLLFGGAGNDTIYGGVGVDFIYGGTDSDTMFGGAATDYYYWSRMDGAGDHIVEDFRTSGSGGDPNVLVVTGEIPLVPDDTGVFEADMDIMNETGMVRVYQDPGDTLPGDVGDVWRLEVIDGSGDGSYVTFDPRDVPTIVLWNHDPDPGMSVTQTYTWNGSEYVFIG